MTRSQRSRVVSITLFAALSLGIFVRESTRAADGEPTRERNSQQLIEGARPAIVLIHSSGRTGRTGGTGSGFVVDRGGIIATNLHVVGEGREFSVRLADGRELTPTEIIGFDRSRDVLAFRVAETDLPALELASTSPGVGQPVVTVGNPLGLEFSAASGIISELRPYDGRPMIQVAMPIEPGNSGSPLLDAEGKVLGIIAIKTSASIGFACPIADLSRLLDDPRPIPIARWTTIGALDPRRWRVPDDGARWRQRAGRLRVEGQGRGFGGRTVCLAAAAPTKTRYELAVGVRLDDESGAAGLVFGAIDSERHYGFYPTAGSLRLTRFEGPDVFSWSIIETVRSPVYRRGEWNAIAVRLDGEEIVCSVDGVEVIRYVDPTLSEWRRQQEGGLRIGLCKFRAPAAQFRNFVHGEELEPRGLSDEESQRVTELAAALPVKGPPPDELIDELAGIGAASVVALDRRARELEAEAFRLRHLATMVHERRVQDRLAEIFWTHPGSPRDEDGVDLLEAALRLAELENRDLDTPAYLQTVEDLVEIVRSAAASADDEASEEHDLFDRLVRSFRDEFRFRGSRGAYYHRSNSFLNEVIDDREGIPITLCVLFISMAQKLGLDVVGLSAPRHFLVEYRPDGGEPRRIDVYDACREVDLSRIRELTGMPLEEDDLAPATKKAIVVRMLGNLIGVTEREGDVPGLLRYSSASLRVDPGNGPLRFQRALIFSRTGQEQRAVEDTEWLLEHQPAGVPSHEVHALRAALRRAGH